VFVNTEKTLHAESSQGGDAIFVSP
jgi:hypothetical protein